MGDGNLDRLKQSGVAVDGLSAAQKSFLQQLSREEVDVLIKVQGSLRSDVVAHTATDDTGIFYY